MNSQDPRDSTSAGTATDPQAGDRLNNAAPLLFVLLWSSSFLGTRVGLRHMSPLWFVAFRMILATAIVCGATVVLRHSRFRGFGSLSRADCLHCAVVGVATQAILLMTA